MGKFDGYYLFSDVDGTLMTSAFFIPQNNREALEYFTREGGHFALATGRGLAPSTTEMLDRLPINAPCVLLNGAVIFDHVTRNILQAFSMPNTVRKMLKRLLRERSGSSVSVWRAETRYEVGAEAPTMSSTLFIDADLLPDPWCKLVIRTTPQEQEELIAYLEEMHIAGLQTVCSCDSFVEVMPTGVNKATGIEYIIAKKGIARDHVIIIGDYYNDYEMLTLPGARRFCPDNTPKDLKAVCEQSLCHVDEGAVAALITLLDQEL